MKPIYKSLLNYNSVTTLLLVTASLTFLSLSCEKDAEKFDPSTYDGEYPRYLDGAQIRTYDSQIQGGKLNVSFNGHKWNHTPYFLVNAKTLAATDSTVEEILVSIQAFSEKTNSGICSKETLFIRVPFKGTTVLNAYLTGDRDESHTIKFATMDCDTIKDRFMLDRTKLNFVDIESYDKDTREVNVEFDLSLLIADRNPHFGPAYPQKINLIGGIRTVIRK